MWPWPGVILTRAAHRRPTGWRLRAALELRIGLYLCAATGRAAEALTLWAACVAVDRHQGLTDPPWFELRWEEQLRQAREALGAGRARAAEDRGAEMSLATGPSTP